MAVDRAGGRCRIVPAGALLLLLLACDKPREAARETPPSAERPQAPPTQPPPTQRPIGDPAASLAEETEGPTSARAAATVVETYFALIGAGKYKEALRLRWDADRLPLERFAQNFAPYASYRATVGAPSQIQGAAGSLYVSVPVHIYGQLKSGKPFGTVGTITLRRINDVPGSSPAERRWRIYTA